MALGKLAVILAIIVDITWSHTISNVNTSRHKRDVATTVYGNVSTQVRNSFAIDQNPGSQVIDGSIPTQNRIVTISESGRLVFDTPHGLNDSQVDTLLNLTHEQRNAQVVYNLKQSLNTFMTYSERMVQTVDAYLLEHQALSEFGKRTWPGYLALYKVKTDRLGRTLNRLIAKFKSGDAVTDADVAKAKKDASDVLNSYKKLEVTMYQVIG